MQKNYNQGEIPNYKGHQFKLSEDKFEKQMGFYDRQELTYVPENLTNIVKEITSKGLIPCFLYTTGSYCPPHMGHLNLLKFAKEEIEKLMKFKVVHSYISPSSDIYVQGKSIRNKFSDMFIDFEGRYHMMENLLGEFKETYQSISVDSWEGLQKGFVDFPEVVASFHIFMQRMFEKFKIKEKFSTFLCIGEDLYKYSSDQIKYGFQRTIEVPRIIVLRQGKLTINQHDKTSVLIQPGFQNLLSSTIIRGLIKQSKIQELIECVGQKNTQFLIQKFKTELKVIPEQKEGQ